jgi:alpha-D-ribose 1-methylphosphonate 5-triphosphate synthase subunit PhnH
MNQRHLAGGLADGVHDSQNTFRALLDAMARPGQARRLGPALPGVALGGAMARLLLSLADDETAVWWQYDDAGLAPWLRFHTGAPLADQPQAAAFAVVTDLGQIPLLADFAQGSPTSPEQSTTLLLELPAFEGGVPQAWRGPGIEDVTVVSLAGLSADFWRQCQTNQAGFPQGVDMVLTCGEWAIGLPRSTQVQPALER